MKILLVFYLISVASSRPQGYEYNIPSGGQPSSLFNGALNTHAFTSTGSSGHINSLHNEQIKISSFTPGFTQDSTTNTIQGSTHHNFQHHKTVPIITKHFYLLSAPEETEEEVKQELINIGQPRINYKVVFIRAPVQSSKATKLALKQNQVEDKTIIYVLSQKSDVSDIQTSVESEPLPISKPEVFFIKYKTPEEAFHAQKQIQAQYDSLGGSTQVSDEGFAHVSSVIGSLGSQHHHKEVIGSSSTTVGSHSIKPTYLPSNE